MKKPSAIIAAVNSSMLEKAFIERERKVGCVAVFCKRANRTGLMFSFELNPRQRLGIFERRRRSFAGEAALSNTLTLTAPDAGVGLMNKACYDPLRRGLKGDFSSQFNYRDAPGASEKKLGSRVRKTGGNSSEDGR